MCLPGSPCFGQSNSVKRCGVSPCYSTKTNTDLVMYNGANLPNTGINTCESMSTVLQKIDEKLSTTTILNNIFTLLNTNETLKNQLKQILDI